MSSKWLGLAAAAPFALVVMGLGAEATGDGGGTSSGCLQDAEKLCKGVQAGGGRGLECLARKYDQLSPACKVAMDPVKPYIIAWRDACGADIDQHCSTLPPTAIMLNCLGAHWSTLAPTCKAKIGEAVVYRGLVCAKDQKEHCSGVPGGAGRMVECLHNSRANLEPDCRKQIEQEAKWVIPWRQVCGADADKLCMGALGTWQLLACLDKNKGQVSGTCKAKVESTAQMWTAVCAADINTHCKGVQPGDGRIVTCLHEHRLQLRPGCKAIVP